jgi:hypothetical protein
MTSFAAVVRITGTIDSETGIVPGEMLDVDHALLDDLGAVGCDGLAFDFVFDITPPPFRVATRFG